jgi:mannosyl-oligosaccharide alpha-1,2-mannosidase
VFLENECCHFFIPQVCFLPGTLALGATKGITKKKALDSNLLTDEDIENLQLAEDLAKTCVEMYFVTSTGLAPEIAYFHIEVSTSELWSILDITSFFLIF